MCVCVCVSDRHYAYISIDTPNDTNVYFWNLVFSPLNWSFDVKSLRIWHQEFSLYPTLQQNETGFSKKNPVFIAFKLIIQELHKQITIKWLVFFFIQHIQYSKMAPKWVILTKIIIATTTSTSNCEEIWSDTQQQHKWWHNSIESFLSRKPIKIDERDRNVSSKFFIAGIDFLWWKRISFRWNLFKQCVKYVYDMHNAVSMYLIGCGAPGMCARVVHVIYCFCHNEYDS